MHVSKDFQARRCLCNDILTLDDLCLKANVGSSASFCHPSLSHCGSVHVKFTLLQPLLLCFV